MGTNWHRTPQLLVVDLPSMVILLCACTTVVASAFGVVNDAAVGEATSSQNNARGDFDDLVQWMRNNGGRVDQRFGVGPFSYDDEGGSYRGGLALEDIAAGTEILFCPWTLVLGTEEGNTANVPSDHCAILRKYAQEVAAGEGSFWYPYLSMDDSLGTRIPLVWGESATKELQGLPPSSSNEIDRQQPTLKDWFCENCAGGKSFESLDKPTQQSLMAVITRAAGMRFMPIFDMLNHHNGLMNVMSSATVDGNSLTTTRDIATGEEIFLSYRGGRELSSDMLRRYGFIEHWPQQWAWVDLVTSKEERFLLMPNGSVAIDPPDSITSRIGQGNQRQQNKPAPLGTAIREAHSWELMVAANEAPVRGLFRASRSPSGPPR